jgi:hypothetical protein
MALPCDVYPLVHSAFNPVGAKGIVAELCVNEDRLAHAEEHVAARGFDMRSSGGARCSISPKLKLRNGGRREALKSSDTTSEQI